MIVNAFMLSDEKVRKALTCLEDNGIDKDECEIVLQALCYILMDTEIYPTIK